MDEEPDENMNIIEMYRDNIPIESEKKEVLLARYPFFPEEKNGKKRNGKQNPYSYYLGLVEIDNKNCKLYALICTSAENDRPIYIARVGEDILNIPDNRKLVLPTRKVIGISEILELFRGNPEKVPKNDVNVYPYFFGRQTPGGTLYDGIQNRSLRKFIEKKKEIIDQQTIKDLNGNKISSDLDKKILIEIVEKPQEEENEEKKKTGVPFLRIFLNF